MTVYEPNEHVRAVADAGGVVFLDIANDSYLSAPTADADCAHAGLRLGDNVRVLAPATAEALLCRGLIAPDAGASHAVAVAPATDEIDGRGSAFIHEAPAVLFACWRAERRLARPFSTLMSWRRPRMRRSAHERIADFCTSFEAFRAFYPRRRVCLFDSVALVTYLAFHRIEARIVFGARTRPFEAHCWVQCGSLALNERVARARSFQPLMAI